MTMRRPRWWVSWRVAFGVAALLVISIYWVHRSSPAAETSTESLAGVYAIARTTNLQIPEVFRGQTITIEDAGHGKLTATNEKKKQLELLVDAEGASFRENFIPVGARILPGVSKNWNEGRLRKTSDGIVVEGRMLEQGMMLFVAPFKNSMEWNIQLQRIADAPMKQPAQPER